MKLLIIAFTFFPMCMTSQVLTGYNSGFVVTNKNDTIYGLLKLRNTFPYRVHESVLFRQTEEAQPQPFPPAEIKGFVIGKEIYESKYLSDKKERKGFFQIKIKGFLSYYEMESYGGPQAGSSYKVLLQKEDTDQLFIYDVGNFFFPFRRKLSEYLKDYPELASKIKHNVYNEVHIIQIVNKYNNFIKTK
ncbi:MAG: hypothetical protein JWP81_3025 [Ferruginibacter sp.]|nr:hypothetical protein [Ferruginibacter sp.]